MAMAIGDNFIDAELVFEEFHIMSDGRVCSYGKKEYGGYIPIHTHLDLTKDDIPGQLYKLLELAYTAGKTDQKKTIREALGIRG